MSEKTTLNIRCDVELRDRVNTIAGGKGHLTLAREWIDVLSAAHAVDPNAAAELLVPLKMLAVQYRPPKD